MVIKEYFPSSYSGRHDGSSIHPNSHSDVNMYEYGLKKTIEEARTLALFNHPHIVKIIELFEQNNTVYIVMEYYDGLNLEEFVNRFPEKRVDRKRALKIIIQILDGLVEVHKKGVIHRDIKPENILVPRENELKIIDFGSARSNPIGDKSSLVCSDGYSPMELYSNNPPIAENDIYSVGATLYRILTGYKPKPAQDYLESPLEFPVKIDSDIEAVIRKSMTFRVVERVKSAEDLRKMVLALPEEIQKTPKELKDEFKYSVIKNKLIANMLTDIDEQEIYKLGQGKYNNNEIKTLIDELLKETNSIREKDKPKTKEEIKKEFVDTVIMPKLNDRVLTPDEEKKILKESKAKQIPQDIVKQWIEECLMQTNSLRPQLAIKPKNNNKIIIAVVAIIAVVGLGALTMQPKGKILVNTPVAGTVVIDGKSYAVNAGTTELNKLPVGQKEYTFETEGYKKTGSLDISKDNSQMLEIAYSDGDFGFIPPDTDFMPVYITKNDQSNSWIYENEKFNIHVVGKYEKVSKENLPLVELVDKEGNRTPLTLSFEWVESGENRLAGIGSASMDNGLKVGKYKLVTTYDPNGEYLEIDEKNNVYEQEFIVGKPQELAFDKKEIYTVSVDKNSKYIGAVGVNNKFSLWENGNIVKSFDSSSRTEGAVMKNTLGAFGNNEGKITLIDLNNLTVIKEFNVGERITNLAISPNEKYLAASNASNDLILIDLSTKNQIKLNVGSATYSVAFMDVQNRLVVTDVNGYMSIWNIDNKTLVKKVKVSNDSIYSLAISTGGDMIATGDKNGILKLWDDNGEYQKSYDILKGNPIWSLDFDSIGLYLAAVAGNKVNIWNVYNPASSMEIVDKNEEFSTVKFSEDGRKIITGGTSGTIKLWDFWGKNYY